MSQWQACPVCKGSKLVSRPPGVAADAETYVTASVGPWPCQICDGTGLLATPDSKRDQPDPLDQLRDVWAKATSVIDAVIGKAK